jgi:TetR/AcrR family transcriptional regulator, regulator of biofilm formation and stress response
MATRSLTAAPGRRDVLIHAAVGLIAREGLAAVSHRTVARAAGVPLGATTYYFASKTELLREALEVLADFEIRGLEAAAARLAEPGADADLVADTLADLCGPQLGLGPKLARFEIFVEAARRPALRPVVERRTAALTALALSALEAIGCPDPAGRAEPLVAGLDGVLLQELAAEPDLERLRARLRAMVAAVAS